MPEPLSRRGLLRRLSGSAGACALPGLGRAAACLQADHIRWIVPHPPGGGYDTYSRLLQPFLEGALGARGVRIENLDGAGGLRGAAATCEASPDGATLGIVNVPGLLLASMVDASVPNPFQGFTLLGTIARSSYLWATSAASGIRSFEDLESLGRKRNRHA